MNDKVKVQTHPGMGRLRMSLAQPVIVGFTSSFTWCWSGPTGGAATGSIWVPTSCEDVGVGAAVCMLPAPLAPGPVPSPVAPDCCCCCWCCCCCCWCCCCCCDKAAWWTATACCWFNYMERNMAYFSHRVLISGCNLIQTLTCSQLMMTALQIQIQCHVVSQK